MGYRMVKILWS